MKQQPKKHKQVVPLTLAIDTSCDDTSAAVVFGNTVLSNVIASQTQLHKPYGGVFPTVAKQAHRQNIERVVDLAIKRARVSQNELSAVAVTQGPGLAPALEVGIEKAKEIGQQLDLPVFAINHIEGHALSSLGKPRHRSSKSIEQIDHQEFFSLLQAQGIFPALSIVVSGGHTEFVLIKAIGNYQVLGETIDDAAGEALDKVGRMLDLGYPAGPVMEQFAKLGNPKRFDFPLPMTNSRDLNLSFSGLKTHARNLVEKLESENLLDKQASFDFAASFQTAVFRHISHKLNKLLQEETIKSFLLGGGVAANIALRQKIRQTIHQATQSQAKTKTRNQKYKLLIPYSKRLCMDNAAMIGLVANLRMASNQTNSQKIMPNRNIDRQPRLRISSIVR
ncbi:MAG: tRNA (adenosine(37)-N6)-threonylcarbamoyltransferase complex transferase subunit TsaD [Patescibacteria group bacterium]